MEGLVRIGVCNIGTCHDRERIMFKLWCFTDKEKELENYLQLQDVKRVRQLLSKGANPNEYSENSKCSYLSMAITQRNEALVRMMLKAGASTNQTTWPTHNSKTQHDEYPLHVAAVQGHLGIVKALLEHGANVNIGQDSKLGTPLHLATKQGHKDVTSWLLVSGADIIAIDRLLDTPLHKAAAYGYTSVVSVLLDKGAPVNARNYCLSTPLHHAAREGAVGVVKMLLERGADPTLRDSTDRTPLDIASGGEIKDLLSACRGKIEFQERGVGLVANTTAQSNSNFVDSNNTHSATPEDTDGGASKTGAQDVEREFAVETNGTLGTEESHMEEKSDVMHTKRSLRRTKPVDVEQTDLGTIAELPSAIVNPGNLQTEGNPRVRYTPNGVRKKQENSSEKWKSPRREDADEDAPKYWEERRGRSLHQPRIKRQASRGCHPICRTQSDVSHRQSVQ